MEEERGGEEERSRGVEERRGDFIVLFCFFYFFIFLLFFFFGVACMFALVCMSVHVSVRLYECVRVWCAFASVRVRVGVCMCARLVCVRRWAVAIKRANCGVIWGYLCSPRNWPCVKVIVRLRASG
jgi:hypothetical protein